MIGTSAATARELKGRFLAAGKASHVGSAARQKLARDRLIGLGWDLLESVLLRRNTPVSGEKRRKAAIITIAAVGTTDSEPDVMAHFDVVVCGLGAMGSAAAQHLTRRGKRRSSMNSWRGGPSYFASRTSEPSPPVKPRIAD